MSSTTAIASISTVSVASPARGTDLHVRVTAPTTGERLVVIVFSHGFGSSSDEYRPLTDFWAASGFVVVQPTHLDSYSLGIAADDPRTPDIWKLRVDDLIAVIDHLDDVEAALPGLAGRLDPGSIIASGHSWGAQSASMLLGARVLDHDGAPGTTRKDDRVKAGVLLSITGTGGRDLSPFAAEHFSFMSPDFDQMTTPALIVAGDQDVSPLSQRGPDWFTDAHRLSPNSDLLTLVGGEHSLGGIAGAGHTATTDENPERVALIQHATTAYLRSVVDEASPAWSDAKTELAAGNNPLGHIAHS
jgi:pimeloyl-ACP methyl ester carboxylesterase